MPRRRHQNAEFELAGRLLVNLLRRSSPTTLLILACIVGVVLLAVFLLSQDRGQPDPTPTPAGASSDWYELHFTDPAIPTNKANYHGGLDEHLVRLMSKATRTLDVADYDFDLANVAAAMASAQARGVRVRMVTDSDTLTNDDEGVQAAFAKLKQAGVPVVDDQRSALMHHKFTVVDGEWVQTGSWNYTVGDTYRLNNHLIILHSRELAENYTAEFEKMFVKRQFGPNKAKGVPHPVLAFGPGRVRNYFAPQDGVAARLIDLIRPAQESVFFLAFSFTHQGIGGAIRDKARAGLKVGGVFETTGSNTPYSEYGRMKVEGLDVYTDGNPYVMHHKVILVDGRVTVCGSFNLSDSADKSNDENTLIIEDAGIAQAFKAEYDRVLAMAKDPPAKKK